MHTTTLLPEKNAGIITSFSDDELQTQIATTHAKYLSQSIELGKNHGRQNFPTVVDSLENATESITANYNELILVCKQRLNGLLQVKMGSEQKHKTEQDNKELFSELDQTTKELDAVESKKIEEPAIKAPKYLFLFGLALFILILFGEIFYMAKALQVTRLNFYQSLIIAFSISISIGAIAHYSPRKINEWFTSQHSRVMAHLMVFGLILTVFLVISYLRSTYMAKMSHQQTPIWIFATINFILYIGLFFVDTGLIQPNFEKIKAIRLFEKQQNQIQKLKGHIRELNQKIQSNNEALHQSNAQRLLMISYAKSLEEQVVKLYHISISQYKDSNRYHRQDNPPISLNQNPKELELYYSHLSI